MIPKKSKKKKRRALSSMAALLLLVVTMVTSLAGAANINEVSQPDVLARSGEPLDVFDAGVPDVSVDTYQPMLDDGGNVDTVTGAGCMLDVYNAYGQGGGLNCTANDVSLATATNIIILDDGCAFPGDTVEFTADFEVVVTANARHDVGIYFSEDGDPNGDGALTGECSINTPAYAPDPPWLDLDGTADNTTNSNDFGYCSTDGGSTIASPDTPCDGGSPAAGDAQCVTALGAGATCEEFGDGVGVTGAPVQDTCGDINSAHNPLFPSVTLTVACVDDDNDGQLDLPYCTSWRQPGANELCTTPLAAYPGAPSKCNCDEGFGIAIDVPGRIIVDKVTDPPGDPTNFEFILTDVPTGTIVSAFQLADFDTPFESPGLAFGTYEVTETANPSYSTTATCDDGSDPSAINLQPGEIVTCTFTNTLLEGPPSIAVTKTANPTSVDEPGGSVDFTVSIENTSDAVDPVTITSLTDNIHGDLNGQGDCAVPQTIQPGDTYTCTFSAIVNGNAGESETDIVTASGTDDEGTPVSDSDDAIVTINDVPSSILVTKTADPTALNEPGGEVTFTVVIENTSAVDDVTIDTVSDNMFGDVSGNCTPAIPATLAPGETITCTFTEMLNGMPGDTHVNTVTGSGTDDDGDPVSDSDDAIVTFGDVPSSILLTKTAVPTMVNEPGDDVTFAVVIENTSAVDNVTIDTVDDTIYGDISAGCVPAIPATLAPGETITCTFTEFIGGNAGDVHTNVATASGTDDDGNPVTDDDDATVDINDVPSAIELIKTADPTAVSEPGDDVTFTFVVNNLSTVDDVTIDSLTDTVFGDLNGQGDCAVPQTIPAGGSYTCSVVVFIGGNAGDVHTNVATASGTDDDGNPVTDDDDATVDINDVPSAIELIKTADPTAVSEPGDDVTFTFVVNNLSTVDAVTIDSLTDTVFGDLNGQGDCAVPQTIPAGDSYSCSVVVFIGGNAGDVHTNVATASGTDDDGNPVSDDDDAVVNIEDVPSSIEVTKTADPTQVIAPGGDVTFTVVVENTSAVDDVTIDSVVDDVFGDVSSSCVPALPATLATGETTECTFTEFVSGSGGDVHVNVATAMGTDDDGNPVEDSDDATVTIVAPVCIGGGYEVTEIVGIGHGNKFETFNPQLITISDPDTIISMLGQVAGRQRGRRHTVNNVTFTTSAESVTLTSPTTLTNDVYTYETVLQPATFVESFVDGVLIGSKYHTPRGLVAYVTRSTDEQTVNLTTTTNGFVYHQQGILKYTETMIFPAPLTQDTTIVVQVAFIDDDDDNRPLIVSAKAGGVVTSQTFYAPTHGDQLTIVELELPLVPAGTSEISITLESPPPMGDSGAMVGVAVNYPCQPANGAHNLSDTVLTDASVDTAIAKTMKPVIAAKLDDGLALRGTMKR